MYTSTNPCLPGWACLCHQCRVPSRYFRGTYPSGMMDLHGQAGISSFGVCPRLLSLPLAISRAFWYFDMHSLLVICARWLGLSNPSPPPLVSEISFICTSTCTQEASSDRRTSSSPEAVWSLTQMGTGSTRPLALSPPITPDASGCQEDPGLGEVQVVRYRPGQRKWACTRKYHVKYIQTELQRNGKERAVLLGRFSVPGVNGWSLGSAPYQ